jgi:hypothetical protein
MQESLFGPETRCRVLCNFILYPVSEPYGLAPSTTGQGRPEVGDQAEPWCRAKRLASYDRPEGYNPGRIMYDHSKVLDGH